jgi:hypothetical protein
MSSSYNLFNLFTGQFLKLKFAILLLTNPRDLKLFIFLFLLIFSLPSFSENLYGLNVECNVTRDGVLIAHANEEVKSHDTASVGLTFNSQPKTIYREKGFDFLSVNYNKDAFNIEDKGDPLGVMIKKDHHIQICRFNGKRGPARIHRSDGSVLEIEDTSPHMKGYYFESDDQGRYDFNTYWNGFYISCISRQ